MKMFLDTSTPVTLLKLDGKEYHWESGRDLAENLHAFLRDKLAESGATFSDISEISFMSGPGSFTGLRIGAAVVNALAEELRIPLSNHRGEKVPIILPEYGGAANISAPKK